MPRSTSKRKAIKTTHSAIAKYWTNKIYEGDLNFDWSEATIVCWNCGTEGRTQRCHIIPDSLGGKDSPENFVLMCLGCHEEAPNCNSTDVMWDWIKSNRTSSGWSGTYYISKINEEYKKLYKQSFYVDLLEIDSDEITLNGEYKKWHETVFDEYSAHFGREVSYATRAGIIREFVTRMKKKYGERKNVTPNPLLETLLTFRNR